MANIQKETAEKIAYAYRDLSAAEELLVKVSEALSRREEPDIRDAFGRRRGGLELGVPHGAGGSRTLYDVPWKLAQPILEAYIASKRAEISVLSRRAESEMELDTGRQANINHTSTFTPPAPDYLPPQDDPAARVASLTPGIEF